MCLQGTFCSVRLFHDSFVVTRCDKASKTYAAVCPALYVERLRSQLATACFQVCAQPAAQLVQQAHNALFPEYFRILCCCHSYYYKNLGRVITSVLRALQSDVGAVPHVDSSFASVGAAFSQRGDRAPAALDDP